MGEDFVGKSQKTQSTATDTANVTVSAGARPQGTGPACQCPVCGQAYGLTER